MWRVVLGYPFAFLTGIDDRGVWRPPGLDDVEMLLASRPYEVPDARELTVAGALERAGWARADCYVHCAPEYHPLPPDAFAVCDRTALVIADWNVAGRVSQLLRPIVDAISVDHVGVGVLERPDGPPHVAGLLWGWDAGGWEPIDPAAPRDIDVLFVGNRNTAIHPARERWLARLGGLAPRAHVQIHSDVYGDAYRELHSRARLVFNFSVRGEANMRSFEAAAAGACVLNERGNEALACVFTPDVDYATYEEHDLEEVVADLLDDDAHRLRIAAAGQRVALAHSYDVHWARILADLRRALARGPRRRPGRLETARAIAEQWRLCGQESARIGAPSLLAEAGAPAVEQRRMRALCGLGGPAGLEADEWRVTDALLGQAIGDGDADAAMLIARAEAAAYVGDLGAAVAAADAAEASPSSHPLGLGATRFDEWQLALEQRLLPARGDEVAAAAGWWVVRRARFVRASVAPRLESAWIDAQLGDDDGIIPMVLLRARLRMAGGYLEQALADLRQALSARPLDIALARQLAELLALVGRGKEAEHVVSGLAATLAGFPQLADERAELLSWAARPAARGGYAWCWSVGLGRAGIAEVIGARLERRVPGAVLRIACPNGSALDLASSAVVRALDGAGAGPDDLPDTELMIDHHSEHERWRRVAGAACVVAAHDSVDALLAQRIGVPLLALETARSPG